MTGIDFTGAISSIFCIYEYRLEYERNQSTPGGDCSTPWTAV